MNRTSNADDAKRQIKEIIKAMTGVQTVENVTSLWNKDIMWFDVFGEVKGIKSARDELGRQISNLDNIRIEILSLDVFAQENMAFAYSIQHLIGEGRNDEPGLDMSFRQTDCFHKNLEGWNLVHQHISLPIDPLTTQAIFNHHIET